MTGVYGNRQGENEKKFRGLVIFWPPKASLWRVLFITIEHELHESNEFIFRIFMQA